MSTSHRSPFGMATLTFLVVANMIGAGVFVTSGYSLASLQSPGRVVLAWVVGGLIATTGALSYGQLVRVMPESGGEYLFLSRAVHPLLGFIAGWVSLIAGFTSAIAFAATTLETYLVPDAARPAWLPTDSIAIAAICLAGLCHGIYTRAGAIWQNAAVLFKLLLLVVFAVVAIQTIASTTYRQPGSPDVSLLPSSFAEASAFAGSLVWISLSYSGFNAAVYVAGEASNAGRVVPRAMVMGTLITSLLYVGLNAIFVYGPPYAEIVGQEEVALIAADAIGGRQLAHFVQAIICCALLTSVTSMMLAAPRVYTKMAADRLLPRSLRGSIKDAPTAAITVQAVAAVLIVLVSTLEGLLSYLSLTLSVTAATSVGCLLRPSVRAGLTQWWTVPVALIYTISTLAVGAIFAVREPKELVAMIATFAVGGLIYVFVRLGTRADDN